MNAREYYRHIRGLGAVRAADALRLAREAAALDLATVMARPTLPAMVWQECLPDGSGALRFSRGVFVF